jgi:ATP-dependent Lon protease
VREILPALEALPLFPLSTVLFPGALMPLHIFEPRYRTMIKEALATHASLAIVLVTGNGPIDAHGHPEIAKVAGAGFIVDHAELPNGRFNVLVHGRARVRLEELPFVPPYRRAKATVITPEVVAVPEMESTALRVAASAFAARVRERDPRFEFKLPDHAPADQLADLCAQELVLDTRERQALLEELDPRVRTARVTEILSIQRVALSGPSGPMN